MAGLLLPPPKTKIAKVLHELTVGKVISEQSFRINSFRSILSDLRRDYGIPIHHLKDISIDEFGKMTWYYKHYTLPSDRKKCKKVYLMINQ